MNLNDNIKSLRKFKNVQQSEIAEKLDISVRTYQKYESGEIEPPLKKIIHIANIFDVSVSDLLEGATPSNDDDIYITNLDKFYSCLYTLKDGVFFEEKILDKLTSTSINNFKKVLNKEDLSTLIDCLNLGIRLNAYLKTNNANIKTDRLEILKNYIDNSPLFSQKKE